MENVIEIVQFKLKEGTDTAQFLADSEATLSFITKSEGFLYRSLSLNEETLQWTDVTYWKTMENAKAAFDDFMKHEQAQQMVSHIEENSVVMSHGVVKMDAMSKCT
ncbi:hypothetical protein AL542_03650 [Grimontia hollisae]|uniref:ABM domain-containing protein n=2 Tax=Grimontia hollisae TaxID=673 RepID=D0IBC0_GRIHO|nr:hypothetical protein [Grimontia hollisae]AMG29578.1 hypothetical protein AL542_03650 [Grimontia hollisae]EEY71188.1 hypothetical protein VHA_003047 [Grimontia hollisae CIP 101886]MDF2186508.1 hypothetical protein [Grimontia hollisae]STO43893.1 Uncharacterised protein [Grimontia hollisae]STO57141.1 Uncharacterised protein [Grimontia hollisae]